MKRILRFLVAVVSVAAMMFTTSCKKQEEDLSLSEPKLTIDQSDLKFEEFGDDKAINHFDLIFYPYKSYSQIRSNLKSNVKDIRAVYDASFSILPTNDVNLIADEINKSGIKTLSHNITSPRNGDLLSINNYLRLNATIATNSKVTAVERDLIVDNIKIALARNIKTLRRKIIKRNKNENTPSQFK